MNPQRKWGRFGAARGAIILCGLLLAAGAVRAWAWSATALSPASGHVLGGSTVLFTGDFSNDYMSTVSATIQNPGAPLTNFPVLVRFDSRSKIATGQMRSDGGDVRVYDSDGTTPLGFWIESGLNTTNTLLWARVPVLAAGSRTIRVVYGTTNMVTADSLTDALPLLAATNNVLWLAANRKVFTNSSGVITQWLDQSVASNVVQQPTPSYLPTLRTGALKGLPVARFTTSQKMYVSRNFPAPYTTIAVERQIGGANARVVNAANNNWLMGYWQGSRNVMYAEGWITSASGPSSDTNWMIYAASGNGGHTAFYGNNGVIASNSAGVGGPNGISLNGYSTGLSEMSDCEVAEVIVLSAYLSPAERQLVHTYLNQKYGVYADASQPSVSVVDGSPFRVKFGGVPAASIIQPNVTNLVVVTPAHEDGVVDVEIGLGNDPTQTMVGAYTYLPAFSDWQKQMTIRFEGYTKAETLTNFPVLLVLNESIDGFRYGDFLSGKNADLRFTDTARTTELNYEVEAWNPAGTSYVWVQVPRLVGTNTEVVMCWGRSGQAASACTSNGNVWSQGYLGVWHLAGNAGISGQDSAALRQDVTVSGGVWAVSGRVDGAVEFDGSSGFIHRNAGTFDRVNGQPLTVSAWINPSRFAGVYQDLVGTRSNSLNWMLYQHATDGSLQLHGSSQYKSTYIPTGGAWTYVAATVDASSNSLLYANGSVVQAVSGYQYGGVAGRLTMGNYVYSGNYVEHWLGKMDEVRISDVARSTNWVWAEYMNMVSNATFVRCGTVQSMVPVVANDGVSGVSESAATLRGSLQRTGDAPVTAVSVFWGTNDAQDVAGNWGASHSFSLPPPPPAPLAWSVSGLASNTPYYFRYAASNSQGWGWAAPTMPFSTWWDPGWQRRHLVTIDNSGGAALTDYPVVLAVTNEWGMQADFDDLRFIDTSGRPVPYWIESVNTGFSCTVWVKLTNLAAGGRANLYLYLDNAAASNASAPNEVFTFFDDFSTALSTSRWNMVAGAPATSNGYLVLGANQGVYAANFTIPESTLWECRADPLTSANGSVLRGADTSGHAFVSDGTAGVVDFLWWSGSGLWAEWDSGEVSMGAFVRSAKSYRITYRPSGNNLAYYSYNNGELVYTRMGGVITNLHPAMYVTAPAVVDWIRIRPYTAAEPTMILGGLERRDAGNRFMIEGRVTNAATGAGVSGVKLVTSSGAEMCTTDFRGCYEAMVDGGWSGRLLPVSGSLAFSPASYTFENVTQDELGRHFAVTNLQGPGADPCGAVAGAIGACFLAISNGGSAAWYAQGDVSFDGISAARSGLIGNSQESWFQATVQGEGTLTFWWKVSSESCCDPLEFYLDGAKQTDIRGAVDWQQKSYTVGGNSSHTLKWRYAKDGSVSNGYDAAWVDQVAWIPSSYASVTLSNLYQIYDGTPREVTAWAAPTGQPVALTYNGSAVAPLLPGLYAVTASIYSVARTTGVLVVDSGLGISGTATNQSRGSAVAGFAIDFSDGQRVLTDANGAYRKPIVPGWNGVATPSTQGIVSVTPSLRMYEAVAANVTGQNYSVVLPLQIESINPTGFVNGIVRQLDVSFTRPIRPSSFTADDVSLSGPGGSISVSGVEPLDNWTYRITFADLTDDGAYTCTVGPQIEAPGGEDLDMDADGVYGEPADTKTIAFEIDRTRPAPPTINTYSPAPATNVLLDALLTLSGGREANTAVWIDQSERVANGVGAWSHVVTNLTRGTHSLQVHARDRAGNTSDAVRLNFEVVNDRLFTQPLTIQATNMIYENLDIVINGTTVAVDGVHSFASLTLTNGAKVTHSPVEYPATNRTSISALHVTVTSNSSFDVTGMGWPGTNTVAGAGGSHGGYGGSFYYSGAQPPGTYGDYRSPSLPGLGGSPSNTFTRGGGNLHLQANELVLDGALRADGATRVGGGGRYGGGAGGSLWVSAGVLRGTGSISANGGSIGYPTEGAGGGGGRIAVFYGDASGFNLANVRAVGGGGWNGNGASGAGTIYLKDQGLPTGVVRIDNSGSSSTNGWTGINTGLQDPLVVVSGAVNLAVGGTLPAVSGTNAVIYQAASMTGSTIRLAGGLWEQSGALSLQGLDVSGMVWNASGGLSVGGTFSFKGGMLTAYGTLELPFGGALFVDGWTFCRASTQQWNDITLTNGAKLTQLSTPLGQTSSFSIVAAVIRISSNSSIDATGLGWTGTNTGYGGGGSHGGLGGIFVNSGTTYPAACYDDPLAPVLPGLGGSPSNASLRGGGALYLKTDELVLDGTLRADASLSSACWYGAGAGGSIWLDVGSLRGGGSMSATGGSASCYAAGGGGGRIAVYYHNAAGFDLNRMAVAGGTGTMGGNPGGSGTIYLKDKNAASGRLLIHNGSVGATGETVLSNAFPDPITVVNGAVRFLGSWDLPAVVVTNGTVYQTAGMTGTSVRMVGGLWNQGGTLQLQSLNATGVTWSMSGPLSIAESFVFKGATLHQTDVLNLPFGGDLLVDGWTLSRAYTQQWNNVTVTNWGRITHPTTVNFQTNRVELAAQAIRVAADSSIDVSGKGWVGTNTIGGAGGSHAGLGGTYVNAGTSYAAPAYGDALAPVEPGYGGSISDELTRGGGVIHLVADELVLDGALRADGAYYSTCYRGGGAGGSIWVETGILRGGGSLSATGGAVTCQGGGGSGGRIAVFYGDASGFDLGRISVKGGAGNSGGAGSNGTVYTENLVAPLAVLGIAPTGSVSAVVSGVVVRFKAQVNAATFALGDLSMTGPAGSVGLANLTAIDPLTYSVALTPAASADGTYTLTVGPDIASQSGVAMTSAWSGAFVIDRAPPVAPAVTNFAVPPTVVQARTNAVVLRGLREPMTSLRVNGADAVSMGSNPWWYSVTLAQGTNDVVLVSRDASGNDSPETHVLIFVDTIAPQVSGVSPPNGGYTNTSAGSIAVTALETGSGIDGSRSGKTLKIGSSPVAGTWSLSGTTLQFAPQVALADAVYTIQVLPIDLMGNTGALFTSTFTIDRVAPAAPGLYPVSSPTVIGHQQASGLKEAYASIWLNGATQLVANTAATTWSADVPLALGVNALSFTARDRAGNVSAATVASILYDNQAPGPVTVMADGARDGTSVKLDWPAYNEVANGDDIVQYRVYQGASSFDSVLVASQIGTTTSGVKTFTVNGLARGSTYFFAVVAVDRASQYRPEVIPVSVTVEDVVPPADPLNLAFTSFRSNIAARWSAPTNSDLAGFRLFFNQTTGAVELAGSVTNWDAGGQLMEGTGYTVRVKTYDTSGNESPGATGVAITWLYNPANVWATPRYGAVDLTWSASTPTQYVKQYWIYMETESFTNVAGLAARATATDTRRSLAGLTVGQTYYFGVVAENLNGGMNPNVVRHEAQNIYSNVVSNIVTEVVSNGVTNAVTVTVTNAVVVGVSNVVIRSTASSAPIADTNAPVIHYVMFQGSLMDDQTEIRYPGTFAVRVSDNSGLGRLEYWLDGTKVSTDTSGGTNSSWTWSNAYTAQDGLHQLVVVARDSFGNASAATNFFLFTQGPPTAAPTITFPANNSSFGYNPHITFYGTIGSDATSVDVYLNGTHTNSASTISAGAFWAPIDLPTGTNRIAVAARNRGGAGPLSAVTKVSMVLPLPYEPIPVELETPPNAPRNVAAASAPTGGVSLAWDVPSPLSAGVQCVGDGVLGYYVYRATTNFAATNQALRLNALPLVECRFLDLPAADGMYYYRVVAVNHKGEVGTLSDEVQGISDRIAPRVTNLVYRGAETVEMHAHRLYANLSEWLPYTNFAARYSRGYWTDGGLTMEVQGTEPLVVQGIGGWSKGPGFSARQYILNAMFTNGAEERRDMAPLLIDWPHAQVGADAGQRYTYGHWWPNLRVTDIAGNIATVDYAQLPTLDVNTDVGPVMTNVVWNPPSPIVNQARTSITVTATVYFDPNTVPLYGNWNLRYRLIDRFYIENWEQTNFAWMIIPKEQVASNVWVGTFVLPDEAGWGDTWETYFSEQLRLGLDSEEPMDSNLDWGTWSIKRVDFHYPTIYVSHIPLDSLEWAATEKPDTNGVWTLQWRPPYASTNLAPAARVQPTNMTFMFEVYGFGAGLSQTSMTLLGVTAGSNFTAVLNEGVNYFGVRPVCTVDGHGAITGELRTMCQILDRIPPAPATNVHFVLSAYGLSVGFGYDPTDLPACVKTYHDTSPFSATNGRSSVTTMGADFGPHYAGVVLVDSAGNESALSEVAYTNLLSVPVNALAVDYARGGSPAVTWGHTNRAQLLGFNVYVASTGEAVKVNDAPLSPWTPSYVDPNYDGSNRSYGVNAPIMVGTNLVVSYMRWIELPMLWATIDANSALKRGTMNRLGYSVTNRSGHAISNITLSAYVQGASYSSQTFSVAADAGTNLVLVVGGFSNLENRVTVSNRLAFSPGPGDQVRITDTNGLAVGNDRFVATIQPERFYRGGLGWAHFTLQNTSEDDIEIVMAKENGKTASPEVRLKMLDGGGRVFSEGRVLQAVGGDLVTLSDGTTVARIAPGKTYKSGPVEMQVPSLLGTGAVVKLEIDQIHYRLGYGEHVAIGGPTATRRVSFDDTPYSVYVTNVTPAWSIAPLDFALSGMAIMKESQLPAARVPVRVIVGLRGFERVYDLTTDPSGRWRTIFRPLSTEGGVYDVYAMHPDLVEKAVQQQFEIRRVMVTPAAMHLTFPRNYTYEKAVAVTPNLDLALTGAYLAYVAADQTNGILVDGLQVTPGPPVSIRNGRSEPLTFTIRGDDTAPATGTIYLRLVSVGNENQPWNMVRVRYTLAGQAEPNLVWSPSYVEAGVARSNSVTARVDLQNTGFLELQNVRLGLVTTNGDAAPGWVALNGASALGVIATGEARLVHVTFSPTNGVPLTPTAPYKFYLRVAADNYATCNVPLYVTVDESGVGGASFHITDIYTGTQDAQGQTIRGLAGARIRLTKETGLDVETNLVTDAWGEAEVNGLPAGRYTARISANEHKAQTVRVTVREGMTDAREVFLENTLVTVEWSVTPTMIQDQYEVTLTTTFKTEVPAAVVVTEPTSVTLPHMAAGDVFNGEFTVKNYGLIQAEDAVLIPPVVSDEYKLEVMAELPSIIPAHGVIRMPYRVVRLSARDEDSAGGGGCPQFCLTIGARYKCPSNAKADCRAPFCVSTTCEDVGTGDGGGGPGEVDVEIGGEVSGGGGGKGDKEEAGPGPEALDTGDANNDCRGSKSGEEKEGDCGSSEAEEPVGSAVELTIGKFVDTSVDMVVPVLGHDLGVVRRFTGNKWHWNFITSSNEYSRVFSEGMTIQRTQIDQDMQSIDPLDGTVILWTESNLSLYWRNGTWNCFSYLLGSDCWPLQGGAGSVEIGIRSNKLAYTIASDETLEYEECAISNFVMNTLHRRDSWSRLVKRTSPRGVNISYVYDERGRTEGVYDHFGHRVLWMNYDEAGNLASVSDSAAGGTTVRYHYDTAGNLTNAVDTRGYAHAYAYANGKLVYERTRGGREVRVTHSGTNLISMVTRTEDQLGWKQYGYGTVARSSSDGALGAQWSATILDSHSNLREVTFGQNFLTKAIYRVTERINGQEIYRKYDESSERAYGPGVLRSRPKVVDERDNPIVATWYEDGTSSSTRYAQVGSPAKGWKPVEAWDEAGRHSQLNYDGNGNVTKVQEAVGTIDERDTAFTYDQFGQVATLTRKGGGTTPDAVATMTYDDRGLVRTLTGPAGGVTRYEFDANGFFTSVTTPRNYTWYPVQNAARQLVTLTDPLGQVTSNAYDAAGNLIYTHAADEQRWWYGYDVRDRLVTASNADGLAWQRVYDGDRLVQQKSPGQTRTFEYNSVGLLARRTDGAAVSQSWQYDILNRVTNYIDEFGQALQTTYGDDYHNTIASARFGGLFVTNAFDPRGRLVYSATEWGTNRLETVLGRDAAGNVTSVWDTESGESRVAFNAFGFPTQIVDGAGAEVCRRYDNRNNLVWRRDANGNETQYRYDAADRPVAIVFPDGCGISNEFDASGNRVRTVDAASNYVETAYDALDRMIQRSFRHPGGTVEAIVTYGWNPSGYIESYDDGVTSGQFGFDSASRTETRTFDFGDFSKSHAYTYDAAGRKATYTGPDGVSYTYGYDALGRVNAVAIPGQGVISFGDYTGRRPGRIAYPGGMVQSFHYDSIGNMLSNVVKDAAGDTLMVIEYGWDAHHRIVSRAVDGRVERYAYDPRGQLVSAELPTLPSQSFAYDLVGNMTNGVIGMGTVHWNYGSRNQLLGGSGLNLGYDANGNLTSQTYQATNAFYRYSVAGRLMEIRNGASNVVATYYYNPWGKRLRKTVGGTNQWFYYSEEGLVAEMGPAGDIRRSYGYVPDSMWSHQPLFMREGSNVYYYLNDCIGVPRKIVGDTGRVVWSADYEPFGLARVDTNSTVVSHLRGSSQYYDMESGLHYNLMRYYAPRLGRYMTPDPVGESADPNLYRFVKNDPIASVDPLGLILFGFDGTGQNRDVGDVSNITRMMDAYSGENYYFSGVGSHYASGPNDPGWVKAGTEVMSLYNKAIGGAGGAFADAKMESAYQLLQERYFKSKDKRIDIIGFSRGAAMARAFANMINERGLVDPCSGDRVYPDIGFLGAFDTVGSFGIAGLSPYLGEFGKDLSLAPNVQHAAHALADRDNRVFFPQTRFKPDARVAEKTFPGVHSDVGGAYKDNPEAGYNPLLWMMDQGIKSGAPFDMSKLPSEVRPTGGEGIYYHSENLWPWTRRIYYE